jgi:hypothetical protein
VPNLQNHTWIKPLDLRSGIPVDDSIEREYQSTWYRLKDLAPGDDVTFTLTGCAVNYTLLGFADVRKKALELLASRSPQGIVDLPAQRLLLAGDTAADDMDSDDMDSDDMDSDDMDSDDMDSDDMDSDDMDSDDMDSDDMDSDDMDSDDMDSDGVPDVRQFADVYAAAQRRALRSASVTPGPADEAIYTTVRAGGGDLYFRVRGHHGAFAPGRPFRVTATVTHPNLCEGARLDPVDIALPGVRGKSALILTNTARLGLADANARRAFLASLRRLEGPTNGHVHDLADDKALAELYAAWDRAPRCVAQANAIVRSIRRLVDGLAVENPLEYVVLAGPDGAIPFMRVVDGAEISRESQWGGPYRRDTPLDASLAQGYFLSDDPYGTPQPLTRQGRSLYIPSRSVGRLVESSEDITGYVDWFLKGIAGSSRPAGLDGITLDRALVTGYGFVTDLATSLVAKLGAAGLRPNQIDRIVNDTWTADDVRRTLFGGPKPKHGPFQHYDLIAAEGHYSPTTVVPASGKERFRSKELAAVVNQDFAGTIWATMGCHSGHDIVDLEATPYAYPDSFVETLMPRGVTFVAGTGYQYGESVLLKNSERLYELFVEELTLRPAGRDGVAIGAALVNAKRRYANELLAIRGIDEKVIGVAALYGLPMLRVRVPSPQERPRAPRADLDLHDTETEGLRRAVVRVAGHDIRPGPADAGAGSFAVNDRTVARAMRPVLPAIYADVSLRGHVATGVVWREGKFSERPHDALIARPATESSPDMPRYRNRAFLPVRPLHLQRLEGGEDALLFAPMQFRSGDPHGTVRLWTTGVFEVFYSSLTGTAALHDAPAIRRPRFDRITGGLRLVIDARHYGSIDEEVRVYASYIDGTTLRSVSMVGGASWPDGNSFKRRFRVDVPGDQKRRFFFQAVGGNGRVGALSGEGRSLGADDASAGPATALTIAVGSHDATYRDRIDVTATLRDAGGGALAGREVLLRLGPARRWVTTDGAGQAKGQLLVAVRPRASYRVVAVFPGAPDAQPSAASAELAVKTAPTYIDPTPKVLSAGTREVVATLKLRSRGVGLGERPVNVKQDAVETWIATDPDGSVRLSPSDIGDPGPGLYTLRVGFLGDDRYEPSQAEFQVKVV